MNLAMIFSLVRQVLLVVGGTLVTLNYFDAVTLNEAIGHSSSPERPHRAQDS